MTFIFFPGDRLYILNTVLLLWHSGVYRHGKDKSCSWVGIFWARTTLAWSNIKLGTVTGLGHHSGLRRIIHPTSGSWSRVHTSAAVSPASLVLFSWVPYSRSKWAALVSHHRFHVGEARVWSGAFPFSSAALGLALDKSRSRMVGRSSALQAMCRKMRSCSPKMFWRTGCRNDCLTSGSRILWGRPARKPKSSRSKNMCWWLLWSVSW